MNIVGILLAAGRGQRFDSTGRQSKLLATLPDGTPVALASARSMKAALSRVVAVVAPGAPVLTALLSDAGCEVIVCEDATGGMAATLTCGVRHAARADGWIIALADMPFVRPSTIEALVQALNQGACIAQPACHGRRGNPVGFSAIHAPDLLALTGDEGARRLLRAHATAEVETDDPGILRDIDRPIDLSET